MTEHATYKELRRSQSDRMVAGVCGGLGRYFDVNPTFYRVGFVVLTLLGGAGLLIYGAAVLVVPDDESQVSIIEEALRDHRDRPFRLIGIAIVSVAAVALLSRARLWPHGDFAWALLLLAGLALLLSRRRDSRDDLPPALAASTGALATVERVATPPTRRRSFPITVAALGLLVIQTGIFVALSNWGVDISWSVGLAIEAVTAGAILISAAFLQMRVGGLAVIGLLLGIAALLASTIDIHLNDGIGDRNYAPTSIAAVKHDYRLGIGDLQVDLSGVPLPAGKTTVKAHVGLGHLLVVVPPAETVRVVSHVDWGDSEVFGESENGHSVDSTVVHRGTNKGSTLVLDTNMGAGKIVVIPAGA